METKRMDRYSINKKLCIFLVILAIIITIVVGVLVWHFTKEAYEPDGDEAGVEGPVTTQTTTPTGTKTAGWWNSERLTRSVLPVHYDITLYPDFYDDNTWFQGFETIEIDIDEATQSITLHSFNLNITHSKLSDFSSGRTISIARQRLLPEKQYLIIETSEPLVAKSKVLLYLEYEGSLFGSDGLYKTTYFNSKTNRTSHITISQFEPISARKAFPCFDEPDMKAEFTVSLVYRDGFTALSNMEEHNTEQSRRYPGKLQTRFKRSVKMSTYLVCFVVGEFMEIHLTSVYNVRISVYSTTDKISQTRYPLDVGNHTMTEFQRILGVDYPLSKQDQVAIPDFNAWAMEHWGILTYREDFFLYHDDTANAFDKELAAETIAHEVAHQWFGNLVTMDWWDHIWLNEGFATYMQHIGLRDFEPTWDADSLLLPVNYQPAMMMDASPKSHPVIVRASDLYHPMGIFDILPYYKGAALLTMLEKMLGYNTFFKGLQTYLNTYLWGNTNTDDFWKVLSEVHGDVDLKEIMDPWTRQMGYPLLTVSLRNDGPTIVLRLEQTRFLTNSETEQDVGSSPFGYKWYIPVDYATTSTRNSPRRTWVNMTDVEFTLPNAVTTDARNDWIKLNWKQIGFYRVNYPADMWRKLTDALRSNRRTEFNAVDRAGLLGDALNLARAGNVNYSIALDMLLYLQQEDEYVPWGTVANDLMYISGMLYGREEYSKWKLMVMKIVQPVFDIISVDHRFHLQKLLRILLINLSCFHEDSTCLQQAEHMFVKWITEDLTIEPDLMGPTYMYGMQKVGTESDWNAMWDKYQVTPSPQQRLKLLHGLASAKDDKLLTKLLESTKDPSKIRVQEVLDVFAYMSDSPFGHGVVWSWVRKNWEYLVNRFSLSSSGLGDIIERIVSGLNTQAQLDEVQKFFKDYPDAGAGASARARAIQAITDNIAWMSNRRPELIQWLSQNIQ